MAASVKTELSFMDRGVIRGFKQSADAVRKFRQDVAKSMEGVKTSLVSARNMVIGLGAAGFGLKKALAEAGQFERFEAQLEVLLKSAEAAKERLEELNKFGSTTPFDLPGVMKASITLESLTRGAMSTGAGLTLVGDAASASGQPIEELAVHVGRLYDGLMNGRPVGQSMARLNQLGLVTAQTRAEVEALQKAGMKGNGVWNVVAKELATYSGTMDKISKTLEGRLSELQDKVDELWRSMGQPISDALGPFLDSLNDKMGEYNDSARKMGERLVSLGKFLMEHRGAILNVVKAWALWKTGMLLLDFGKAILGLASSLKEIWKQVFGLKAAKTALDAETKSLAANTKAQLANASARKAVRPFSVTEGTLARTPKEIGLPGKAGGGKAAVAFWAGFKTKLAGLVKGIGAILAGGITVATVAIASAAAVVAGGVILWAKHQERAKDAAMRTNDFLNDQVTAMSEAVRNAKTEQETAWARADIEARIAMLRKKAAGETNKDAKAMTETAIKQLEIFHANADTYRQRKQAVDLAEEMARLQRQEAEAAEKHAMAEALRLERVRRRTEAEKKAIEEIRKASEGLRGTLGWKLFEGMDAGKQVELLEKKIASMMKTASADINFVKRLAGENGSVSFGSSKDIAREADAARKAGNFRREKELLQLLETSLDLEEKLKKARESRDGAAAEKADQKRDLEDYKTGIEALRAETAGEKEKAESLREQMEIRQESLELAKQLNLTEEEALKLVREKVKAEKDKENAGKADAVSKVEGELAMEMKILSLRAKGRTEAADALEKEMAIRREAAALEEQGIARTRALAIARKKAVLELEAEKRAVNDLVKAGRVSRIRRALRSGGFGGNAGLSGSVGGLAGQVGGLLDRGRMSGLRGGAEAAERERQKKTRDPIGAAAMKFYEQTISKQDEMIAIWKNLGVA